MITLYRIKGKVPINGNRYRLEKIAKDSDVIKFRIFNDIGDIFLNHRFSLSIGITAKEIPGMFDFVCEYDDLYTLVKNIEYDFPEEFI